MPVRPVRFLALVHASVARIAVPGHLMQQCAGLRHIIDVGRADHRVTGPDMRGTPTGWRPTRPLVGYSGSITAIKRAQGTTRYISTRTPCAAVRFFFIAYSALAKPR